MEYWNHSVRDEAGEIIKPGRHKVGASPDVPAWKPLWCEHRGPDRIAWTPLLMHSERVGGKPRQQLLNRLPTIRSCCIKDRFIRAAWWYEIEQWARIAEENIGWNDKVGQFIARDKRAILAKLREVVPAPTEAGIREFTAYRLEKEAEARRVDEEIRADMQRKAEEDQRRREEYRRAQEEQARRKLDEEIKKFQREWERLFGTSTGSRGGFASRASVPDSWAILGLPPTATKIEVKARYRELVMQYHPDRFGDEAEFKRVQAAYESIMETMKAR